MEPRTTSRRRVYQKAPRDLVFADLDREVLLDPARTCTFCGATIAVAKVVRPTDGSYDYACLGCALQRR